MNQENEIKSGEDNKFLKNIVIAFLLLIFFMIFLKVVFF